MLILASASPRRHELLVAAGIEHIVRPSHIPEIRNQNESVTEFVKRIAAEKAAAVVSGEEDIVLGADTIVCLEAKVLGKPVDRADAAHMLRALSGRDHSVVTGIALRQGSCMVTDSARTQVWFNSISESEIQEYIETGEPMDKAGAYGIQGYASRFIGRIEGSYHNVVGLPVSLVYGHLKSL